VELPVRRAVRHGRQRDLYLRGALRETVDLLISFLGSESERTSVVGFGISPVLLASDLLGFAYFLEEDNT
jgi:hypothetical protein